MSWKFLSRATEQTSKKILNLSLATILGLSGMFSAVPFLFPQSAAALSANVYVSNAGSNAAANDCSSVSAPCQTITYALTQVSLGGTVNVVAGDYSSEGQINVSFAVNLVGANATISDASITSSDATVSGFTFNNVGSQINVSAPSVLSGVVIENDTFSGYDSVAITTYNAGNILIQGNTFQNPSSSAEPMQIKADGTTPGGCNGTRVLTNVFNLATSNGSADVNFSCTDSNSSDITVSGNTSTGVVNGQGASFIALSGITGGITISDNNATSEGSSVYVFGGVSGAATISGNSFSSSTGSSVSIHGAGDSGTDDTINTGAFTISSNDLSGSVHSISVASGALSGSVAAHDNDLSGDSGSAVVNNSSPSVDASLNYWGTAVISTIASEIAGSGLTTYTPYYVDAGFLNLNTVTPSTVYVDPGYSDGNASGHSFGWDAFTTIQAGVDAVAPGGTVNLAAGTYEQGTTQISINKSLTIQGPNAAISPNGGIRVPEAIIHGTAAGGTATFNITSSSANVSFQGLEFQNMGATMRSDAPGATISLSKNIFTGSMTDGMYFQDPVLTVNDNLFTNIDTPNADTIQVGGNYPTSSNTVTITNNTWSNITESGALNLSSVTGTISGNHFSNVDYYGVLVANQSGDLTISGNVFDHINNPTPSPTGNALTLGAGIRTYHDPAGTYAGPINITGNTFSNSYLGIGVRIGSDITGASFSVNHNSFTGNTSAAILNAGTGTLDATQNWWGSTANPSGALNGQVAFVAWCTDATCSSLFSDSAVGLSASGGVATTSSTGPMTLTGSTASGNVTATIPAGTIITDSTGLWDGTLNPPLVSSYSVPGLSGYTTNTLLAFSIGSNNYTLTFSRGVRLLLPGQAGQRVGFIEPGGSFTEITTTCSGDDQTTVGDALPAGGACKINDGSGNLIIWTKHFTIFATYSQTANSTSAVTPISTPQASVQTYTVVSGDTLSGIGAGVGVDWHLIASLNGINAPYTIYPGQVLRLPGGSVVTAQASGPATQGTSTGGSAVLGSNTGTGGGYIGSAASTTKAPAAAVAKAVKNGGKFLGIAWYLWLVGLVVLAGAGYFAYLRTSAAHKKS